MLAHPDRGIETATCYLGQDPGFLLFGAESEQGRRHLPVGHPVRRHRRALGKQLFGDDVAVQMFTAAATVVLGNRQTQQAGLAEPDAEIRIPARQPRVDGGLPAELRTVCREELADPAANGVELLVMHTQ